MKLLRSWGPWAVAASAGLGLPAYAAPALETINGIVAGAGGGGCTSVAVPELAFFVANIATGFPNYAACGYSGGYQVQTSSSVPLTQTSSLGPVSLGLPIQGAGPYFGTASSKANFGSLGAAATSQIVDRGTSNGQARFESVGASTFSDTLVATSPQVANGSAGLVSYVFQVGGSLSALGAPEPFFFGETYMSLDVVSNNFGPISIANATVRRGGLGSVNNGPVPAGWTTSMGSLSGSSSFTSLALPMVFGQPWDVKFGLLAFSYGSADTNFLSTATLTGFRFFDGAGVAVNDFNLSAASGTNYLAPVPEPTVAVLLTFGIALLACRRRLV